MPGPLAVLTLQGRLSEHSSLVPGMKKMMSLNTTPAASCPSLATLQEAELEAPRTGRALPSHPVQSPAFGPECARPRPCQGPNSLAATDARECVQANKGMNSVPAVLCSPHHSMPFSPVTLPPPQSICPWFLRSHCLSFLFPRSSKAEPPTPAPSCAYPRQPAGLPKRRVATQCCRASSVQRLETQVL